MPAWSSQSDHPRGQEDTDSLLRLPRGPGTHQENNRQSRTGWPLQLVQGHPERARRGGRQGYVVGPYTRLAAHPCSRYRQGADSTRSSGLLCGRKERLCEPACARAEDPDAAVLGSHRGAGRCWSLAAARGPGRREWGVKGVDRKGGEQGEVVILVT